MKCCNIVAAVQMDKMEKLQEEMKSQELQLEDMDAAKRKITVSDVGVAGTVMMWVWQKQ